MHAFVMQRVRDHYSQITTHTKGPKPSGINVIEWFYDFGAAYRAVERYDAPR